MQGNYITISDFESYKQNEMDSALGVLDMNLRNENRRNQVAARLLGFSSYEAMVPMFNHQKNLYHTIDFQRSCPYQGDRPVFRHRNLLVVLDVDRNKVFGRTLDAGEERDFLFHGNADWSIALPSYHFFASNPSMVEQEGLPGDHDFVGVSFSGDSEASLILSLETQKEGICVRCSIKTGKGLTPPYALEWKTLRYDNAVDPDAMNRVDQAALAFEKGRPCSDKVVYRWLIDTKDALGSPRLLRMDHDYWDDERLAPTDLVFHSIEHARQFPGENDMDYSAEDFEGLTLCRVTNTPV